MVIRWLPKRPGFSLHAAYLRLIIFPRVGPIILPWERAFRAALVSGFLGNEEAVFGLLLRNGRFHLHFPNPSPR